MGDIAELVTGGGMPPGSLVVQATTPTVVSWSFTASHVSLSIMLASSVNRTCVFARRSRRSSSGLVGSSLLWRATSRAKR